MMKNDIKEILVTEQEIESLCERIGHQIENDYKDKKPLIVGLLKGCQPFMANVIKYINCYIQIDYMKVSSYSGTCSGELVINKDLDISVEGKDVILIDDIVDTGRTIDKVSNLLKNRGAKSVEICCLLDKPDGRIVPVDVKYPGLWVPNKFVVGYGLDYNELYRNLPYIGVLKEEVYQK
ncbi:MAG: hypoxanthine phosphoribosyltransferase [Anaeroplasmataceae bacterium]